MRIYLIRHGRQSSRLCNVDVSLSSEGKRQAYLLGQRLAAMEIDKIYSSDLLRSVETAREANVFLKVPHEIRQELREISFGLMEGMTDERIAADFGELKNQQDLMAEDIPYPQGECGGDVAKRALPLLFEMGDSGHRAVAVITHGGLIRSVVSALLGMDMAKYRLLSKELENCSITELLHDGEKKRFYLERLNDYNYLEGEPELLRRYWKKGSDDNGRQ